MSEEQSAKNEAVFRDANEKIEARRLEVLGAEDQDETAFLCECDDPACTEVLMLSLGDYERTRESGRRFLVAPGHVSAAARVLARESRFWVVEKEGAAGRVAKQHDPRQRADGLPRQLAERADPR